jgi:hypothetical protein
MALDLVPLDVVSIVSFEISPLRIVPAQILVELVGGGGFLLFVFLFFLKFWM